MLMLLIRLCAIFIFSTFEQITFFWNQACYTATLKNIRWYTISKSLRTTALDERLLHTLLKTLWESLLITARN